MKLKINPNQKDFDFYRKTLTSEECLCGNEKKPGYAFCYRCYSAIEDDILQKGLYANRSHMPLFSTFFEEVYQILLDKQIF
jgi:hypothetical protein